ncbi:MAG: GGDEF domain-containing protein [Candidatus Moraniibacteriota bacterium]|nr:MAG: GGDEF domain-containing protein [Candidatus Moranbacteria bacterium]
MSMSIEKLGNQSPPATHEEPGSKEEIEKRQEKMRVAFANDLEKRARAAGVSPEDYLREYAHMENRERRPENEKTGNETGQEYDNDWLMRKESGDVDVFELDSKGGRAINRLIHSSVEASLRADRDALTGLSNRHALERKLAELSERNKKRKKFERENPQTERRHEEHMEGEYSLMFVDLDHFKKINDNFNHDAGDVTLQHVAHILKENVRQDDGFVARWGGEEFVLIIPSSIENACRIAERIRKSIESTPVRYNEREIPVRASFGVAAYDSDVKRQLNLADTAVLTAKGNKEAAAKNVDAFSLEMIGEIPEEEEKTRNQVWFVKNGKLQKYHPETEGKR